MLVKLACYYMYDHTTSRVYSEANLGQLFHNRQKKLDTNKFSDNKIVQGAASIFIPINVFFPK
jgi:hypothetical protein